MDVLDQVSIKSVFDQVEGVFGCVDVVINNVGIGLSNLLLKVMEDEWDRVFDINLKGVFMVVQEGV